VLCVAVIIVGLLVRNDAFATNQEAAVVIDSDVPGTKVYLRGQLLGVVPVQLSHVRLAELSLKCLPPEASSTGVEFDGWGEGVFFGDEDQDETKLMFQVPDAQSESYLNIQTPWGRRTKVGGGSSGRDPNQKLSPLKANMFPVGRDGLRLQLSMPGTVPLYAKSVNIDVSLTNVNPSEVTGYRPEIMLLWGTFDTPWRCRSNQTFPLPPAWSKIAAGQTLKTSIEVTPPSVAEDYSFFAVFNLFAKEQGNNLKMGSVYSESHLLRVRCPEGSF
jgi:hypothetical protein